METYEKGTRLRITFTGTVVASSDIHLSVKRDKTSTESFFTHSEFPGPVIEVLKPEFDPKAGEVYLLRAKGLSTWTPWFVIKNYLSQKVEMVSAAGVFSLSTFVGAYITDNDYDIVKANVVPV